MASSTGIKCCPALGGVAKLGSNFSCAPNYGSLVALPREQHDGIYLAEIVIFPGAANHKLRDQGFVSTARAFGLQLFSWLTFDGQRRPGVLVDLINFDGLSSTVSGTFAVVLEPPFKIRSKFKSLEDCKVYLVEHIAEMHQTLPHDVELAAADDDSLDTWVAHQPQFKQMGITPASINAYIRQVHLDKKIELATKMAAEHVTQYMAKHHSGKKATTATATKARADLEGMNRNVQAWLQKRAGYLKLPMQHRVFCVKVASSFISLDQAQLNLDREIGDDTFETTKIKAKNAWEKEFRRIEIDSDHTEYIKTFYSCLYRVLLFPRTFYEYDANNKMMHYSPYNGKVLPGYMFTDNGFWDTF